MRPALRLAVSLLLVATQAQRAAEAAASMDDHPTARSVPAAAATPVADAPSGDPEPAAQWPALTADSTEELIVELTVNGAPAPAALIVRRDAEGALLIKASDLATLRLLTPADGGVLVDGELYYRIGSEPGVQLTFDPATQTAALALPPAAFAVTRTGAGSADTRPAVTTSPGGFINYDLYAERIDTMGLGAIAEAG